METILTVNHLTKKFGYLTAVNDLSFTIEKGNVYGILGPNGSGKSTTLGIILNVVNRTSGEFSWFDGSTTTHDALKKVGAIIERPNFYPYIPSEQYHLLTFLHRDQHTSMDCYCYCMYLKLLENVFVQKRLKSYV